MANKNANGKKSQKEQSVMSKILDMVPTQVKGFYVIWKYAPQLLPKDLKTFEDLTNYYQGFTSGMTEAHCETWLSEEAVQSAAMYLLKRLHKQKMIELYQIYFDKAKEDVQSFKAFSEFSDKFFEDGGEDELRSLLKGIKIDSGGDNSE